MRTLDSPRAGSVTTPLTQGEGGTGATTAQAARAAIQAIGTDQVDAPNGIAGLDDNGRLSINAIPSSGLPSIALKGSLEVVKGGTIAFSITNYDRFTKYKLQAVNGSVALLRDQVVFTAGMTAGPASLTVNGKKFPITITNEKPNTPTLSAVDGRGPGANAVAYLQASAFSSTSGTLIHSTTDWVIATDSNFNNVVASSYSNAVDKTSWTSSNLNLSSTFYARARYRDTNGVASNWSNVVTIVTDASYTFNVEEAKVAGSDRQSNDLSGYSIAISSDGSRIVMGSPQSDPDAVSNSGAVYVFKRNGLNWIQEVKLTASDKVASDFLGRAVAINSDGTRIAASAPNNASGASNKGSVYVWRLDNGLWTFEQKLSTSDGTTNDMTGDLQALSMDATGTRIAVGVRASDPTGLSSAGAVYVFSRLGNAWSQEAKVVSSTAAANFLFGHSVDISADGSVMVIGSTGNSIAESGYGEQIYLVPGTYTFTVPAGVFSLSMVGIAAGAGGTTSQGGGGGSLSYKNNFAVQPGDQFTVVVGDGGDVNTSGGFTRITKVGGGLDIFCPGGNAGGQGTSAPTGGDFNNPGAPGTSNYQEISPPASNTGYIFMGGGGLATYNPIGPNLPSSVQSGGSAGPGQYTNGGVTYTVYQSNDGGSFSASLSGSNQSTNRVGYGGGVYYATLDQQFYAGTGANGGVRFVWGSGKVYPTNAVQSSVQGAAFVFTRNGSTWSQAAMITPSVLVSNSEFGHAVSISGDGQRIAVSARNMDTSGGKGRVFVYRNQAGSWVEEQVLSGSARATQDFMGQSLSLNSDGSVLAVGEFQARVSSNIYGAFYVYLRSGTIWLENAKNFASDPVSNGSLGHSVAVSGNGLRVVAGSTGAQFSATAMGAAYIYR